MSDQKAAKAAEKKAEKEAAIAASIGELKAKHPQLADDELRRLAMIEMRRRALDRQAQRVLNPRVNAKADTRRKVIIGAMLLDEMSRSKAAAQLVSTLVGRLKEADKKLFGDIQPGGHDLLDLLREKILPESLAEAEASQSQRFTLTFQRDPALLATLKRLIAGKTA